jgi:hypothetical protein
VAKKSAAEKTGGKKIKFFWVDHNIFSKKILIFFLKLLFLHSIGKKKRKQFKNSDMS